MSVNQAFLLATRHCGLALRREDIGIIAPAAQADLVVFDNSSSGMLGWNDPVAAVMMHAGIGDIEHVLVDGQFRKKDFKLTHPDYTGVQRQFLHSAQRIQKLWAMMPQPSCEGQLFFNQSEYGTAKEIDTLRGPGTGYGTLDIEL